MSRLLMSNSEVQAICRNRSEQRNLSDKLDHLDQIAFQSKDAIVQDLKTWRKFRRENVRNSGWSPKSIRPEPGEDVFCPTSSSGRSTGNAPHSPTQGKDASFTKPWAYTYSEKSHNKVYKELAQVSQNCQKALDLSLKSKSFDSAVEDEQPSMLKHAKTVQALSKAASALTPAKTKLLSLRQSDEPNCVVRADLAKVNEPGGVLNTNKLASKMSTIKAVNKFSKACMGDKANNDAPPEATGKDTLMKSVTAMKGLARSKKILICFKCGNDVEPPDTEERLPKVALAYKGLHRAQTLLKLSAKQNGSGSDNQVLDEPKPRVRKCCAKCRKKNETKSKEGKSSNAKSVNKFQTKIPKQNKAGPGNRANPNRTRRRLSSVSDLSEDQIHRLQIAREKVSKCFEIPCDEETDSTLARTGNLTLINSAEVAPNVQECAKTSSEICAGKGNDDADTSATLRTSDIADHEPNNVIKDQSSKYLSSINNDEVNNNTKVKKHSLHDLTEAFDELGLTDEDFSFENSFKYPEQQKDTAHSSNEHNEEDEYPSDISHQQVMKVIQEEVIDKLNKLTNKRKSPPLVRKFSTISRASTVFKLGVHRKKKTSKTSGVDVFTRIAKFMLFQVWKRRRERLRLIEQEEINKSSKKISQANFRATFLSLSNKPTVETEDGPSRSCIEQTTNQPTSSHMSPQKSRFQFQGDRMMVATDASFDDPGTRVIKGKCSDSQMFDTARSSDNFQHIENQNRSRPINDKINPTDQNTKDDCVNQNDQNHNFHSSPKKQLWQSTTTRITHAVTFSSDNINNNNTSQQDTKIFAENTHNKNDNDKSCLMENYYQNENTNQTDNENERPSTSQLVHYANQNKRKPLWMSGNEPLLHSLKPDVYHKGIKLSNYVCPEKRYLTVKRKNAKKDLSVRWHSAVGAMVNKHEVSQEPMLAEKTFPKQARNRALNKMIEANHAPAPDDTAKVHNEMLRYRIQEFLHSVEPYRQK